MTNHCDPRRLIFDQDRTEKYSKLRAYHDSVGPRFVCDSRGWILFGPRDVRGRDEVYLFCLQKLPNEKAPRVRVGCRYYDLKSAWQHWGVRKKGQGTSRRNECAQAVAIIRLMLLQAQAYGLLSLYATPIKFDSSLLKPKRK